MSLQWTGLVVGAYLIALVITSGAEEYVVRDTDYGQVRGFVKTVLGSKKVERYFRVPFAAPPVGELRFEVSDSFVYNLSDSKGNPTYLKTDILSQDIPWSI